MNFLAHIYLSGDNDDLKIGNFMADSIKGKNYNRYSGNLRKGILLHREIDTYTDAHPLVRQSSSRLFKRFRHYNGVIVDVFYDHFLAKNWSTYHSEDLETYVAKFYQLLEDNFDRLPSNVQRFFPIMRRQNWLLSYAEISGIEHILFQMSHRIKNNICLNESVVELRKYYADFADEFETFFPEIIAHVDAIKTSWD